MATQFPRTSGAIAGHEQAQIRSADKRLAWLLCRLEVRSVSISTPPQRASLDVVDDGHFPFRDNTRGTLQKVADDGISPSTSQTKSESSRENDPNAGHELYGKRMLCVRPARLSPHRQAAMVYDRRRTEPLGASLPLAFDASC